MTRNPRLSQLLQLLIKHGELTISEAAAMLDLPDFMALRFASRLVHLGYATPAQGKDQRYLPAISGFAINVAMRPSSLQYSVPAPDRDLPVEQHSDLTFPLTH